METPHSDVLPAGLAEFAFIVLRWANGQDVGPPPLRWETSFFLLQLVYGLPPTWYIFALWIYQWPSWNGAKICSWSLELAVLCPGLPAMSQYQKMHGVNLVPLEFVVTPANGGTRLASVELPVPIQETSKWWGFSKFDSCQFYYLKPYIFKEFSILTSSWNRSLPFPLTVEHSLQAMYGLHCASSLE